MITEKKQRKKLNNGLNSRQYLPLGLDLKGTKCLVVGGGKIALRKTNTLVNAGADVTIVSPELIGFENLISDAKITWISSEYDKKFLDDHQIIISATSNKDLNALIGRQADSAGKLSCVVSSGKNSNLIFPAVYSQNGINVAVHSNGKNCLKSKYTKNRIADFLNNRKTKELLMFGFYRNNLPPKIFSLLDDFTKSKSKVNPMDDDILFVSTCQRWECYVYSSRPNEKFRSIFEYLKTNASINLCEYANKMYQKSGINTFHHLVRLSAGLDSSLVGETDIVSQMNSAINNWLQGDSPLRSVFELALVKSKKIRNSSFGPTSKTNWLQAIINFIEFKKRTDKNVGISVLGKGAFVEKIRSKITEIFPAKNISKNIIIDLDGTGRKSPIPHQANIEYYCLDDISDYTVSTKTATSKAMAEKRAIEQSLIWYSSVENVTVPSEQIKIGLRSSELSLLQFDEVLSMLTMLYPDLSYSIEKFSSPGDRDKITPLPAIKEQNFFTKDLDNALASFKIDIAVHSAKDLPEALPEGLSIAAITPSLASWDCLVSRCGKKLLDLPVGAKIGTSSKARAEHVKSLRPDVEIIDIRGDVPARIEQLDTGKYDAIILASVGLIRLELQNRITEIYPESIFPTTPGQGSLALVTRKSDRVINDFLRPLNLGNRSQLQ